MSVIDYSYGVGLGRPFAEDYRITSTTGHRTRPNSQASSFHKGTDFATPVGTPMLASLNGVVVRVATQKGGGGWGHYTAICDPTTGVCAQYSHLSEIGVKPGQTVKMGDVIGKSGNSGNSTGPHLDYMVTRNGRLLGMDGKEFGDSGFSWLAGKGGHEPSTYTASKTAQPPDAQQAMQMLSSPYTYATVGGTMDKQAKQDKMFLQDILSAPTAVVAEQPSTPLTVQNANYLRQWLAKPLGMFAGVRSG